MEREGISLRVQDTTPLSASVTALPNVRLPTRRSRLLHLLFIQPGFHKDTFDFLQNRFVLHCTWQRGGGGPKSAHKTERRTQEKKAHYTALPQAQTRPFEEVFHGCHWYQMLSESSVHLGTR